MTPEVFGDEDGIFFVTDSAADSTSASSRHSIELHEVGSTSSSVYVLDVNGAIQNLKISVPSPGTSLIRLAASRTPQQCGGGYGIAFASLLNNNIKQGLVWLN